jgi:multicomponent Na+:H+ antiporter subunit B
MNSLILSTTARILLPLFIAFSLFLLLRGHNLPGGGFAGGLVASAGLGLRVISSGVADARVTLHVNPRTLAAVGLLVAIAAGLVSLVDGAPFLTGYWFDIDLPLLGETHIGTPLLFDVGVYLVVIGAVLTILFTLAEE